jgi:hypothetical protein
VAWFSLAGIPRWQLAGAHGALAVTTSGRSVAILHGKDRQLCKGFDMTAEPTTSGVDATRPPFDQAAAVTRSLLGRSPDQPPATRPPREEQPMTTQAAPPAATSRLRDLLPTLLDLVIPTAGYFLLHWAGLPDVWALTIAGSATGVNALVNTIRRGRLDALGLLVVAEVGVSVVLLAVTADPRLILVRPAVYLAVAGVVNLVSCFAGRPLSYTASTSTATKGDPERAVAYERGGTTRPSCAASTASSPPGSGWRWWPTPPSACSSSTPSRPAPRCCFKRSPHSC